MSKPAKEKEVAKPIEGATDDPSAEAQEAMAIGQYHDLVERLKFVISSSDREGAINDLLDDIEVALKDGRSAWFIRWLIVWNIAPFAVKRCGGVVLWFVKLFVAGSG